MNPAFQSRIFIGTKFRVLSMSSTFRIISGSFFMVLLSCIFVSCKPDEVNLFDRPVEVFKVAGGLKFAEGPAVDSRGDLYFSDIPNSKTYKWTAEGGVEVVRENTARGNGLYFNQNDELYTCETKSRQITRMNKKGITEVVTDVYEGKRYNKPNDLWIHPNGGVYFTDPSYYMDEEDIEQDAEAVYFIPSGGGSVSRVTGHITRPNGIVGTSNGTTLYVVSDVAHQTWKYRINEDGSLGQKELFVENGHDGLTLDERGNLYIANRDNRSVDIYDPQGCFLESISFPEPPSNVCFAGKERNILFATAVTSVYGVQMNVSGQ